MIAVAFVVWRAAAVGVGVLIGRGIRLADAHEEKRAARAVEVATSPREWVA